MRSATYLRSECIRLNDCVNNNTFQLFMQAYVCSLIQFKDIYRFYYIPGPTAGFSHSWPGRGGGPPVPPIGPGIPPPILPNSGPP